MSAAALGVLMLLAPLHPAHAQKKPSRTPRAQPSREANEAARYIKAAERLYEALEYERARRWRMRGERQGLQHLAGSGLQEHRYLQPEFR